MAMSNTGSSAETVFDAPGGARGDLSEKLLATSEWTDHDLDAHGIPRVSVPFVSVGGGLGSFAMVDTLRIAGVPAEDIRVISDLDRPSETYEHLADNSQIPQHERLRSDSGSVLDCIWGWPGYALRESWAKRSAGPAWQVATEPILADFFTPQAGQVYRSVDREAERISWGAMLTKGIVRTIRRRQGGDYFVLYTPADRTSGTKRVALQTKYVHVAVGYPGLKMLPDLQDYRERTSDLGSVVNAYHPHGHVYEEMQKRPTTVLIRGSGIVASRVLQRIIDDRDAHGAQTKIVHLFRNYPDGWQGERRTFRRPARSGWAYQAFNYPKAAWGGQIREQLLKLEGPERAAFIDLIGGTNTAPRADWREQIDRGTSEGFYTQQRGTVSRVSAGSASAVEVEVQTQDGHSLIVAADFIVDATGLEANIEEHRVLCDLLDHVGASKNPKQRLDVDPDFLVRGCDSGEGRLYASGSITLGGYYAGVDSFLGLQYAALQIVDSLARQGFGRRIGPLRSTQQWLRWARNKTP